MFSFLLWVEEKNHRECCVFPVVSEGLNKILGAVL